MRRSTSGVQPSARRPRVNGSRCTVGGSSMVRAQYANAGDLLRRLLRLSSARRGQETTGKEKEHPDRAPPHGALLLAQGAPLHAHGRSLFSLPWLRGQPNAQAEARATEYKPTPAKKRPLWPVASSAVLGPAHAAKRVEPARRCTNAFDAESPQRCVAMRANAVGRLRACHAVISLATLPSVGWVASMARSYSVKRCTM